MLYYAQEAELDVFLSVATESSLPAFIIWLCLQNKSSFSYTVFLSQLCISPSSLPPPICTYNYCHCQLCLPSASRILQSCNHRTFLNLFIQIKDVQLLSGVDLLLRKAQVPQQRLLEPAAGRERLQEVSLPSLAIPPGS